MSGPYSWDSGHLTPVCPAPLGFLWSVVHSVVKGQPTAKSALVDEDQRVGHIAILRVIQREPFDSRPQSRPCHSRSGPQSASLKGPLRLNSRPCGRSPEVTSSLGTTCCSAVGSAGMLQCHVFGHSGAGPKGPKSQTALYVGILYWEQ